MFHSSRLASSHGGRSLYFLREYLRSRDLIGSVTPSSRRLANALARYIVPGSASPRSILEVGPGTGAVTRAIYRSLGPADSLEIVEPNLGFAELLAARYVADQRVTIVQAQIQDHPLEPHHSIVCGVPFSNFEPDVVRHSFSRMLGALHPRGTLSFFTYVAGPRISRFTGSRRRETIEVIENILGAHEFGREMVLRNIPPANVHHLIADRLASGLSPLTHR